ncbi:phage tail protein [Nocardia sp. CDC159]|uniref:Phage tail protein n=1 Tax=Nocardia pulmonis TaxID=2951408 RepID=A0A9X2EA96_9NOCA|nr:MULTISPECIES: phage tail protein [Nocardia]MCM6774661.1 phage tail protein [Nocardia pulmonis]MCM6787274.1 phage tail protein [Nocardia sp. CDC159]
MAQAATIEVEGVDGSHWVLAGPGQGREGVELGTTPTGLYDAPVTTIWNSTAFQIGATYGGANWQKRDVVFGVNVYETGSDSWETVDSAWRKAWAYDRDSKLIVTTEFGARTLHLRMSQQPEFKPLRDPHLKRWGQVTMTCTAGIPWWVEDDVTATAVSTIDTRPEGKSETLRLPVSNPTDQPLWLRWVATAPGLWTLPDFSWADDKNKARVITLPPLAAGQDITVDTDPMEEMIVAADSSSVWARMGGKMFLHSVPPWTPETELPVTVEGAPPGATIQVRCPRSWSRPWGLQ